MKNYPSLQVFLKHSSTRWTFYFLQTSIVYLNVSGKPGARGNSSFLNAMWKPGTNGYRNVRCLTVSSHGSMMNSSSILRAISQKCMVVPKGVLDISLHASAQDSTISRNCGSTSIGSSP